MAVVPELLLATLNDLGKAVQNTFIRLEYPGRKDTISKMVGTYQPEDAVKITLEILRKMNQNQLAETLKNIYLRVRDLAVWCQDSKLSLNVIKTKEMIVDDRKRRLIQRVRKVMPIADDLLRRGMIQYEMFANISTSKTNPGKMREVYKALQSGGTPLKAAFYRILLKNERLLIINLVTTQKLNM
uniref:CARD domain-containing protein n=1 Tax=Oncorhynchus tshawytscha TaxID=74940 RepID=A0A8C8D0C6_ONCTS